MIEDSLFLSKLMYDLLSSDPQIQIVGIVKNCEEALQKIEELQPDVVTVDTDIPKIDTLAFIKRIMTDNPTPIIMFSKLTRDAAEQVFEALELGVVDYIYKPSGDLIESISYLQEAANEIILKVKMAASANLFESVKPTDSWDCLLYTSPSPRD